MSEGRFRPRPTSTRVPDQGADHLVAEGVGLDLEGQQAARRRDQGRGRPGHRRRPAVRPGRPAPAAALSSVQRASVTRRWIGSSGEVPGTRRQKARKSCSPSRASEAAAIGPEVERVGHVPGQPGQQRVGHRGVDHQVAVPAGDGRAAGVEAGSGPTSASRTTMAGPSWLLHDATTAAGSRPADRSAGRSKWTTWSRAWTPASVRPAQVRTTGIRATRSSASASAPATVRLAVLGGEAVEARSVVGDPSSATGRTRSSNPPGPGGGLTPVRCGPSGRCRPDGCPA